MESELSSLTFWPEVEHFALRASTQKGFPLEQSATHPEMMILHGPQGPPHKSISFRKELSKLHGT